MFPDCSLLEIHEREFPKLGKGASGPQECLTRTKWNKCFPRTREIRIVVFLWLQVFAAVGHLQKYISMEQSLLEWWLFEIGRFFSWHAR